MQAHDEDLGPIDVVVIGYPADAPMTGEAVPLLLDLTERTAKCQDCFVGWPAPPWLREQPPPYPTA